jgi:hypothetical protein
MSAGIFLICAEDSTKACGLLRVVSSCIDAGAVQVGSPAQHAINCKAWIMEVVALLLLAFHGPAADPEVHQAVSSILSVLLFGSAGSHREENGGPLQPDTVLRSVLEDAKSLSQCKLATSWLQYRVCCLGF